MNKLLESSSIEYDSSAESQPIPKAKEEDETDAFRGIDYISESKTPPQMKEEKTEQGMKTYSLSIFKRYVWNIGMKNKNGKSNSLLCLDTIWEWNID